MVDPRIGSKQTRDDIRCIHFTDEETADQS